MDFLVGNRPNCITTQLMAKVHKDSSEIAVVFLKTVVETANMRLIEKSKHMFFELPTAFARNNFDQCDPFCDGLLDNSVQLRVNLVASVINIVKIQYELRHQNNLLAGHDAVPSIPQIEASRVKMALSSYCDIT
jgi:hypothetical protein